MKRRTLFIIWGMALLFICITVAICLQLNTPPRAPARVLGVVLTATEDQWKDTLLSSIKAAARKHDMEVMPVQAERSQLSQIEALRALIVYQADAIVFSPVIETGWDNILLEADRAGIPVIAVDKAVQPGRDGLSTSYVGYDYYEGAKSAGEYVLSKTQPQDGALVELYGTVGSSPAKAIARGFREALATDSRYRIHYSVSGDYMRSRGREVIEGLLQNGYEIGTIVAHNNAMTLGAIDAIESANLIPGKDIRVICCGSGPETEALFYEGKISFLVKFEQENIAKQILQAATSLIAGDTQQVSLVKQGQHLTQKEGTA